MGTLSRRCPLPCHFEILASPLRNNQESQHDAIVFWSLNGGPTVEITGPFSVARNCLLRIVTNRNQISTGRRRQLSTSCACSPAFSVVLTSFVAVTLCCREK